MHRDGEVHSRACAKHYNVIWTQCHYLFSRSDSLNLDPRATPASRKYTRHPKKWLSHPPARTLSQRPTTFATHVYKDQLCNPLVASTCCVVVVVSRTQFDWTVRRPVVGFATNESPRLLDLEIWVSNGVENSHFLSAFFRKYLNGAFCYLQLANVYRLVYFSVCTTCSLFIHGSRILLFYFIKII